MQNPQVATRAPLFGFNLTPMFLHVSGVAKLSGFHNSDSYDLYMTCLLASRVTTPLAALQPGRGIHDVAELAQDIDTAEPEALVRSLIYLSWSFGNMMIPESLANHQSDTRPATEDVRSLAAIEAMETPMEQRPWALNRRRLNVMPYGVTAARTIGFDVTQSATSAPARGVPISLVQVQIATAIVDPL